jgi:autotransporter-associated beta strand protein
MNARFHFRSQPALLVTALASLGVANHSKGQTVYQWNGTTNSSWGTSANWTTPPGVGATASSTDSRLNVYNGAGQPLVYSGSEGSTIYANTAGRGLVISFAGGSLTGSMEITGGSFSTLGSTQADVIGNFQNGILAISGTGSFTGAASFAGGAVGTTAGGTMVGLNSSGGTSILNIRDNGSATLSTLYLAAATATVNLDGGTVTANQVVDVDNSGAPGNSNTTFNFNGGILRAGSDAATAFLGGLRNAYVRAGGAKIDTNGKDITIGQALLRDTALGVNPDGGLTKSGGGTLTLSSSHTYTGATTVSAGTLLITGGSMAPASPLSVASGATFQSNVNNTWGNNSALIGPWTIAGTFRTNSNGNAQTMPTNVTLNGGTMGNNGLDYAVYGNFLNGGGTTLTANGTGNSIGARVGMFSGLTVQTPLAGDELTVSGVLGANLAGGNSGGLTKTGAGTLTLSGVNSYAGNTTVANGSLVLAAGSRLRFVVTDAPAANQVSGSGTAVFNGEFGIDTTAVSGAAGHIWQLVDRAALTGESFDDATFSVVGFADPENDGVWTMSDAKGDWSFSEATGELTLDIGSDYDGWATANGIVGGENDDDDSDGLSNFEEYAFGLDPTGGSSANPIASPLDKGTGKFSYTRRDSGLTDLNYTVWFSEDLLNWTQDTGAAEGTPVLSGEVETVEVTLSALPGSPLPAKLFVQMRAN